MNEFLDDGFQKYVDRALSVENRKPYDGDSNAPYRLVVEMAEVGPCGEDEEGGFWCCARIPRQVDNELGGSFSLHSNSRQETIELLELLIEKLKG